MSITSALISPPMPDTRRPDLRSTSADSVLRAASRTGNPARMARVAIVPPNAPRPTISICMVSLHLLRRRDVLGLAVPKGPVFLRDFDQVDEDIFLANLHPFVEMIRKCFVEALLQLGGTAAIQCYLKDDAIVRPMDAEILPIEWQVRLRVFRDDLK